MKKKIVKWIVAVSTFALLTGTLSACGIAGDIINQLNNGTSEPVSEASSTVITSEITSDEGWEKPSVDVKEPEPVKSDDEVTEEDYLAFFEAGAPIYVEYEYPQILEKGKSYTLDEMVEYINKEAPENWAPAGVYVMEVGRAFIDCGNDGIPEMVIYVNINNDEYYDELDEYYVVKMKDGKLTVVDNFSQQGRSMCEVNKYGIYHNFGSSGASLWYDGYYRITPEGKHEFIFDIETMHEMEGPVIYGHDLPSDAEAPKGVTDWAEEFGEYTGYKYGFMEYTDEMYDDVDAYDEYKRSKVYIFYDPDGKVCFPSDKDEKIYSDAGIRITDEDNLKEFIAERFHEVGVTDEEMQFDDGAEYAPSWVVERDYVHTEGQGGEN